MVFRCKCYDLAYDKQPKRSQILMVMHQMPSLCYSYSEQLLFYQLYHIPVLFLLLTALWTCENQSVERGIVGLHLFNIQYLVSFFTQDIDSACWSSKNSLEMHIMGKFEWFSFWISVMNFLRFFRLHLTDCSSGFSQHKLLCIQRWFRWEKVPQVFKVNGLSRSLSLFCIDGKSEVPF